MVQQIERSVTRPKNTNVSINRKAQPEEIAALIAFLLSDETTFITGSIYSIDGGWAI